MYFLLGLDRDEPRNFPRDGEGEKKSSKAAKKTTGGEGGTRKMLIVTHTCGGEVIIWGKWQSRRQCHCEHEAKNMVSSPPIYFTGHKIDRWRHQMSNEI